MKLKNKTRLLNELVKAADNPVDFIYGVLALQNKSASAVFSNTSLSSAAFYVMMNSLRKGGTISTQSICKIAEVLDIDPSILNRVVADYSIKVYLKKQKMELIRTLRKRTQTKRQEEIHKMAEETITLSDFESNLYIAYAGTPFVPIEEDWTPKEIVQELAKLRANFVNAKLKQLC